MFGRCTDGTPAPQTTQLHTETPSSDADAEPATEVLWISGFGLAGGGEIGLDRYLEQSRIAGNRLLVGGEPIAFKRSQARGVPVLKLPEPRGVMGAFRFAVAVSRQVRRLKPPVVVANGSRAILTTALTPKRRGTLRCAYMRVDIGEASVSWIRRVLTGLILRFRYDRVLANSEWTASTFPFGLSDKAGVAYPTCGVPFDFAPTAEPSDPTHIVSMSRICHWKGIDVLIDALELLEKSGYARRIRTTIAGSSAYEDPRYEAEMRARCARLTSVVDFVGHVDDPAEIYRSGDVLVHCARIPEPFGQVVPQGMASGLMTIATAHGGPAEMISHGLNGLLLPPGDARSLADALAWVIEHPDGSRRVRESAIADSRRFYDNEVVDKCDQIVRVMILDAARG